MVADWPKQVAVAAATVVEVSDAVRSPKRTIGKVAIARPTCRILLVIERFRDLIRLALYTDINRYHSAWLATHAERTKIWQ